MSDIMESARRRLAEIEQEAETLKKFLESAKAAEAILNRNGPAEAEAPQPEKVIVDESVSDEDKPVRTRVTDNPKPAVIVARAKEILRANRRPMSRRQLHEALAEKGLVVRGVDPIKTLGTILWRASGDIQQVPGWGYWPADEPVDTELWKLLG